MIELRDMQLLMALSRHRHFARAARDCGISQPAFSMRIRNLELSLDVPIVNRGNRFQGFTEEGEVVLRWARRLLDDARALEQEVGSGRGEVQGTLTIGVVPTALAWTARLPVWLGVSCPGILVRLRSASSLQIQQGIEDGTLDAGVTYADGVPGDMLVSLPLYEESYVLVAPEAMAPRLSGTATWAEAAALPQSLLVPEMQNRRILDRMFAASGRMPRVVAESNAFTPSLVHANEGFSATVVPLVLADTLAETAGVVVLPLTEPDERKAISLVFADRTPGLPTVLALQQVVRQKNA